MLVGCFLRWIHPFYFPDYTFSIQTDSLGMACRPVNSIIRGIIHQGGNSPVHPRNIHIDFIVEQIQHPCYPCLHLTGVRASAYAPVKGRQFTLIIGQILERNSLEKKKKKEQYRLCHRPQFHFLSSDKDTVCTGYAHL